MYKRTVVLFLFSLVSLLFVVVSMGAQEQRSWQLIWSDEFDQDGTPDPQKWSFHGRNFSAWARYAFDSEEMAYVRDGNLVLVARNAVNDTLPYQTAAISTLQSFAFRFGKLECRARFAPAQGSWPAIWLMPKDSPYGGWPKGGEIDVMEHLNFDTVVYQTVHTELTRAVVKDSTWSNSKSHATTPIDYSVYNIYGIEWTSEGIDFFVNGKKSFVYPRHFLGGSKQYPFDQDFYIILNQALGGDWVGKPNPDHLPVTMEVDWVRVYQ